VEAAGLAQTHQILEDGLLQFLLTKRRTSCVPETSAPSEAFRGVGDTYRVFTEVLVGAENAFLLGPLRHDFRVRNHNAHQTGLGGEPNTGGVNTRKMQTHSG